jgi:RNA polymerase sigma factor (sigma-70 family)
VSLRVGVLPQVVPCGPLGSRELRSAGEDIVTEQARDGSDAAFGELYRRHVNAARTTARYILRNTHDADDVVADAFAGVLSALRNGSGPRDTNFRGYLLSCVRNGCTLRSRQRDRAVPVDPTDFADSPDALEDPERFAEADVITTAYSSLPAPWQRVLWMTEVEDRPLDDVAANLHLGKQAAAALSYRAHQGLTEAYLSQSIHSRKSHDDGCALVAPQLARYVRGRCWPGTQRTIRTHLDGCTPCSVLVVELGDVNHNLRGLMIAPFALGAFLLDHSKAHGAAATASSAAVGTRAATAFGTRSPLHAWLLPAQVVSALTLGVLTVAPEMGNTPAAAKATAATASETAAPAPDAGPAAVDVGGSVTESGAAPESTAGGASVPDASTTGVPSGGVAKGVPAVTVPAVTPGVTIPSLTTPGIDSTVPPLPVPTIPNVTIPDLGLPPITVPPVGVPAVTLPSVPVITVPPAAVPPVSVPPVVVTVPPVVVPPVTAPPVVITVPPVVVTVPPATASGLPGIDLGSATSFAVLANTAVTSTGATSISGDVGATGGVVTGLAATQFLTGSLASLPGSIGGQSAVAKASLNIAALVAAPLPGVELGGTTLGPGTYRSGTLGMTGTLVLDGGGDPNALFVFKAATTLITASASHVVFINGAQPCNVFWNVGSSATLGTFSTIAGTIIAEVSITATTGVAVNGRLIARGGAVTLDTNTINVPACA